MAQRLIKQRVIGILVSTIIMVGIGDLLCRKLLVSNACRAVGIVEGCKLSSGERNYSFLIYEIGYQVSGKQFFHSCTSRKELNIGDTVTVRYSSKYPDVADILD